METKTRKVALIGTGAVGTSFLYSAINTGLAQEYILIDVNTKAAEGHALDLEDTESYVTTKFCSVKAGEYKDLKDVDLVVITAGRPQKPNETRLDMVEGNAIIMKSIAEQIKKSGFKGITLIASNPVDIMTATFQEVTQFDSRRVISSGTSLDTTRLRIELSKLLSVNPAAVKAYVLGEHGDSSVSTFSAGTVGLMPLTELLDKKGHSGQKVLDDIHEIVWKKAYEIIDRKGATFYGIGVALNRIASAILQNESAVLVVGAKLEGQYGHKGFYFGTPCVISLKGIKEIFEVPLNKQEKINLDKSVVTIKEVTQKALEAIKK